MSNLSVRHTKPEDFDRLAEIYRIARETMKKAGNPDQWGDRHPPIEMVADDIRRGLSYAVLDGDRICGVFALIFGEDPTYKVIEDGAWLNSAPYATIHRIASDGSVKGVLETALDYAESQIGNVRIDTHRDNAIMQHLLAKFNYRYCGIIRLANGDPRLAYQKSKKE